MAKTKSEKIDLYLKIGVSIIAILAAVLGVNNYFAKRADVEHSVKQLEDKGDDLEGNDLLLNERLDISITDDQIFQQEQQIQQMQMQRTFEPRPQMPELTPMEKQALEDAQKRLETLKEKKAEKVRHYEELRKK